MSTAPQDDHRTHADARAALVAASSVPQAEGRNNRHRCSPLRRIARDFEDNGSSSRAKWFSNYGQTFIEIYVGYDIYGKRAGVSTPRQA